MYVLFPQVMKKYGTLFTDGILFPLHILFSAHDAFGEVVAPNLIDLDVSFCFNERPYLLSVFVEM